MSTNKFDFALSKEPYANLKCMLLASSCNVTLNTNATFCAPASPALQVNDGSCIFTSNAICRYIMDMKGIQNNIDVNVLNDLFDIEEFQLVPAISAKGNIYL